MLDRLDPKKVLRIKTAQGELRGLKTTGFSWRKPSPLASFYGVANGQIPMDLRLDDLFRMTVEDGLIGVVENDGAAGSAFRATAGGGGRPTLLSLPGGVTGADFGGTMRIATFDAQPDMHGTHMLMAVAVTHTSGTRHLAGRANSAGGITRFSINRVSASVVTVTLLVGGNSVTSSPFTLGTSWAILEVRLVGDRLRVWCNGALVSETATTLRTMRLQRIGTADSANNPWDGKMGRTVSVVVGNHTADYPAIQAARKELARQYGLTM